MRCPEAEVIDIPGSQAQSSTSVGQKHWALHVGAAVGVKKKSNTQGSTSKSQGGTGCCRAGGMGLAADRRALAVEGTDRCW